MSRLELDIDNAIKSMDKHRDTCQAQIDALTYQAARLKKRKRSIYMHGRNQVAKYAGWLTGGGFPKILSKLYGEKIHKMGFFQMLSMMRNHVSNMKA